MGFLKKIFKPVSKVLDKIIPNEIKPLLPYAAAFAPYAMPGIMGIGGNTMLSRALMSGGLNIGAQLAQEGSEGDINLLSAGLGALQGAMTAPGTPGTSMKDMYLDKVVTTPGTPGAAGILEAKAAGMQPGMMKSGLEALSGGSKFLTGAAETLQKNPFSVEGLKAAAIPFAQGTADVMYAEGQRDLKDLAKDVVDDMGGGYTDDAYRAAIRKSMTAYGATEEEIVEAIIAAGYKSGGRVALSFGGIGEAVEKVDDKEMKETMKFAQEMDIPISDLTEEFIIQFKRKPNSLEELKMFYKDKYEYKGPADVKIQETMTERLTAKEGGRIGLRQGGGLYSQLIAPQVEAVNMGGQNGPMGMFNPFEPILGGGLGGQRAVFPRLNQLEQGVNRAEGSLNRIRNRLGEEQRGLMGLQPSYGIQPSLQPLPTLNRSRLNILSQLQGGPVAQGEGMKDGGTPSVLPKGVEADYRGGGFIPIGSKERADDVPARLSENEFVMTADAVRAAGGGSVNQGAKRMYNLMHNLEARA